MSVLESRSPSLGCPTWARGCLLPASLWGSDEPCLSRELGQGELRESLGLVTLAVSSKLVQPLLG